MDNEEKSGSPKATAGLTAEEDGRRDSDIKRPDANARLRGGSTLEFSFRCIAPPAPLREDASVRETVLVIDGREVTLDALVEALMPP